MLDPDVVLRADRAAVEAGASREVRGVAAVADTFRGRARAAQPAIVNGAVGLRGKIVEIDLVADPERLRQLDPVILKD